MSQYLWHLDRGQSVGQPEVRAGPGYAGPLSSRAETVDVERTWYPNGAPRSARVRRSVREGYRAPHASNGCTWAVGALGSCFAAGALGAWVLGSWGWAVAVAIWVAALAIEWMGRERR
jgi:hypothetical protein